MRYQQIDNTVSVVSVNGMARVIEPDGSTHVLQEGEILKPGALVVSEETSRISFDPVSPDGGGQTTDILAQATDQSLNNQSIQTANALLDYQFISVPMQAINVSGQVRVIAPDGSTHLVSEGEILQPGMLLVTDANSHLAMEPSPESPTVPETQLAAQPGGSTDAEIAALQQAILSGQEGALQATAAGKTPDEIAALQQAILQGQDPTLTLEATAAGGAPAAGGAGVAGASGNGGFVVVDRTADATIAEAGFDTTYQSTPLTGVEDPSALLASDNTIPTLAVTPGELDEAVLDSTPDADTDLSDGSLAGQAPSQITGNIIADFLADVPGSVFFSDPALQPTGLTSGGVAIVWSLSADGLILTGAADGQIILTITLSADGTSYVADLDGPLDHAESEDSLSLAISLTAQDSNGDQVTAPLVLTILDDAPVANADNGIVTEDGPLTANGNLLANDTQGADGATVTAIAGGSLGQPITGDFGTLTVNADGSYSFVLDNASTQVQSLIPGESLSQVFSYTLTDGDGDTSTATLTITVNGADDGVIIEGLSGEGAEVVVSDANLADGSSPDAAALTQTGTFDISAPDGVKSLSVAGVVLIADGEVVGLPLAIPSPLGNNLTITAISFDADSGTGTISYSYTLLDNEFHTQPALDEVLGESFSVVLVDDNDSTTSASLDVQVLDDVPSAQNDSASVTEDGPLSASGNLLANDTQGADGASVSAIAGGDVGQAFKGDFGTLTVNADGSYSFVLDNASPQVQALIPGQSLSQDFSYTITDADGDTSTATLTITVNGADDGIVVITPFGFNSLSDANLPDGSAPDADALTRTGSFVFTASDGVSSLMLGGVMLIENNQPVSVPVSIPSQLGNEAVITAISFDPDTGLGSFSYSYTLLNNEQHQQPTQDLSVTDPFELVLVDMSGTSYSQIFNAQVLDDVPTARNDSASVTEDGPISANGNLLTNDTQGADGATVTAIAGGSLGQPITGDFGTLTVNADGSYSFVLDNASTQVQSLIPGESLSQVFSYTLTDGDGDTSTATLTITVNGADDGVIIEGLSGEGAEVVVSDANLADGSSPDAAALTQTGTFDISAPDGVKSLSVAGVVLIANGEVVGLPLAIPSPLGNNLTITAISFDADSGTGTISYSYTLLDNEFHTQPALDEVLGESFSVVLVDDNDSTTSASLDVQVLDDVPSLAVAADDLTVEEDDLNNANAVGNNEDGSTDGHIAHGSLADNFAFGADGAGASKVVSVSYDGTPYTADDEGNITITTAQWSLVVDSASGEYDFTLLDNVLHDAVQGENWALDAFSIALGVTVEDADGDQVTDTVTLNVNVQDDIPVFDSVMDAVLSSATTIDFDGRYQAAFGADGLDFITTALGSSGIYAGAAVSFIHSTTEVEGVSRVDVTDVQSEVLFSFYYTSVVSKVSEGGDGSTVIHAFSDLDDPSHSQFFNLTVNGDGTYNVDMVSNTVISTTTASGEDFKAFGPTGEVSTLDGSITIYGGDADSSEQVNASNNGIGVNIPTIESGEWLRMDFTKSQTYVRFSLQQFGGGGTALLMLSLDGVAFDFNTTTQIVDGLTISKPAGGELFVEVEVNAQLANTWSFDAVSHTYTVYVADSFDDLQVDHDGGSLKFNVNDITYDQNISVDDLALNFDMAITDMDGDTSRLDDQLTVVMLDPSETLSAQTDGVDEDAGVVLVGNGEDDILVGGTGDDILIGGQGNDSLTGGDGADIFKWLAEDADGSTDTVTDFHLGEDKLDLADVLDSNANSGNLDQYLDVSTDGVNTIINVYGHGIPDPTPVPMPAPDLVVVLEGVAPDDPLSDLVSQNSIIV